MFEHNFNGLKLDYSSVLVTDEMSLYLILVIEASDNVKMCCLSSRIHKSETPDNGGEQACRFL